jgi:ABC-2 type transport system ATP-binding protein
VTTIEFNNIHHAYTRGEDALAGVTFAVDSGDVVGLLGRNGAGKTTLLRVAMGMLAPQSGAVSVFGLDPRRQPVEVKRRVGYVSEDQILPPFLRIEGVVELHRALFPDWDDDMARHLLDRFGLAPRVKIRSLSKGQARRVALVCAVSHRPELLLLDEPAGGLDPAARREFLETSIQTLNETGTTILFSSHHMNDVERMARRVVMLHDGRVLLDNEVDALREAFSIVLIPFDAVASGNGGRMRIQSSPDCVAVRERADAWHAVFRLEPERANEALVGLGIGGARCRTVGLEEMFIELAEGQQ